MHDASIESSDRLQGLRRTVFVQIHGGTAEVSREPHFGCGRPSLSGLPQKELLLLLLDESLFDQGHCSVLRHSLTSSECVSLRAARQSVAWRPSFSADELSVDMLVSSSPWEAQELSSVKWTWSAHSKSSRTSRSLSGLHYPQRVHLKVLNCTCLDLNWLQSQWNFLLVIFFISLKGRPVNGSQVMVEHRTFVLLEAVS